MANKYIIHGATFNGDGTSSAEATSNGGVGAWNTITYFEGTAPAYGTLAAGDVVYIRSKDAAGSNITRTMTANTTVGSASATSGSWITWVVDNGSVWPGVNGSITYSHAASWQFSPRIYNRYVSSEKGNLKLVVTGTGSPNTIAVPAGGASILERVVIDSSGQTGAGTFNVPAGAGQLDFVNCEILIYRVGTNGFYLNATEGLNFYDTDIRIDGVSGTRLFTLNDNAEVKMFGGSIYGAGATSGSMTVALIPNTYVGVVKLIGTAYPINMPLINTNPFPTYLTNDKYRHVCESVFGDGLFGAEIHQHSGVINSRNDGYFPTLSAVFPDDNNTPWSWQVYPRGSAVGNSRQLVIAKFYSGAPATKTITLNVLISNYITGANKGNVWIEVDYIDSAGNRRFLSSRDDSGSALDSSSAAWSTTSYGAINCTKRQVQVTTPYAVKQNSQINVVVHYSKGVGSTSDILFVCPEVVLT